MEKVLAEAIGPRDGIKYRAIDKGSIVDLQRMVAAKESPWMTTRSLTKEKWNYWAKNHLIPVKLPELVLTGQGVQPWERFQR